MLNGNALSSASPSAHGDDHSRDSPSDLSSPAQLSSPHRSPSAHHDSPLNPASDVDQPTENSDSGSDVDAEGSEDDDYNDVAPATNGDLMDHDAPTPDSTSPSTTSNKRKSPHDEHQYIREDPELYGLRRSV